MFCLYCLGVQSCPDIMLRVLSCLLLFCCIVSGHVESSHVVSCHTPEKDVNFKLSALE